MAAERALWEDMSLEGKPDRVVSITAYRNSNCGVKYITGLEFIYSSGIKHPVGYVFGERSGEVQLWENEIISRLEIKSGLYGILEITVCGGKFRMPSSVLMVFSFTAKIHAMDAIQTSIHWLADLRKCQTQQALYTRNSIYQCANIQTILSTVMAVANRGRHRIYRIRRHKVSGGSTWAMED